MKILLKLLQVIKRHSHTGEIDMNRLNCTIHIAELSHDYLGRKAFL